MIEFKIWIKLIEHQFKVARGAHLYKLRAGSALSLFSSFSSACSSSSSFFLLSSSIYIFLSVSRPVPSRPVSLMASSSSGNAIPAPGTPKKLHLFTRVCVYSFDDLVSNFLFQMQYGSWYRLWLMNLLWSGKPHWLLSRTSLFCMLSPKPQPSPPPPIVPRRTSMHYFA